MSTKSRQEDAYRFSNLYDQLFKQGKKAGILSDNSTDEEIESYFESLRQSGKLEGYPEKYIGDDLSDESLDSLWTVFAGTEVDDSYITSWWKDKPHQLAYRLLLRLTRVEAELDEVKKRKSD